MAPPPPSTALATFHTRQNLSQLSGPKPFLFERHNKHSFEVSDIRRETMTEADAREELSSYVVIRLEKLDCSNEIDEEGYPMRPTWKRVSRALETDLSPEQVTQRVRELIRGTESALEKKIKLGPAVQRQIEKAHQKLDGEEPDPRYRHVLIQLHSRLKRNERTGSPPKARKHRTEKEKRYKVIGAEPVPQYKYERLSVTLYFRREPGHDENAMMMLRRESGSGSNLVGRPLVCCLPFSFSRQQFRESLEFCRCHLTRRPKTPSGPSGRPSQPGVETNKRVTKPPPTPFSNSTSSNQAEKYVWSSEDEAWTVGIPVGYSTRQDGQNSRHGGRCRRRPQLRPEYDDVIASRHHSREDSSSPSADIQREYRRPWGQARAMTPLQASEHHRPSAGPRVIHGSSPA